MHNEALSISTISATAISIVYTLYVGRIFVSTRSKSFFFNLLGLISIQSISLVISVIIYNTKDISALPIIILSKLVYRCGMPIINFFVCKNLHTLGIDCRSLGGIGKLVKTKTVTTILRLYTLILLPDYFLFFIYLMGMKPSSEYSALAEATLLFSWIVTGLFMICLAFDSVWVFSKLLAIKLEPRRKGDSHEIGMYFAKIRKLIYALGVNILINCVTIASILVITLKSSDFYLGLILPLVVVQNCLMLSSAHEIEKLKKLSQTIAEMLAVLDGFDQISIIVPIGSSDLGGGSGGESKKGLRTLSRTDLGVKNTDVTPSNVTPSTGDAPMISPDSALYSGLKLQLEAGSKKSSKKSGIDDEEFATSSTGQPASSNQATSKRISITGASSPKSKATSSPSLLRDSIPQKNYTGSAVEQEEELSYVVRKGNFSLTHSPQKSGLGYTDSVKPCVSPASESPLNDLGMQIKSPKATDRIISKNSIQIRNAFNIFGKGRRESNNYQEKDLKKMAEVEPLSGLPRTSSAKSAINPFSFFTPKSKSSADLPKLCEEELVLNDKADPDDPQYRVPGQSYFTSQISDHPNLPGDSFFTTTESSKAKSSGSIGSQILTSKTTSSEELQPPNEHQRPKLGIQTKFASTQFKNNQNVISPRSMRSSPSTHRQPLSAQAVIPETIVDASVTNSQLNLAPEQNLSVVLIKDMSE